MKFARALLRMEKRKEAAELRQTKTRQRWFWRKTAAMTTAFTLLANPLSALAAIESGNADTIVNKIDNRYEVETSRRFGQNAVNVFNEFGLDANQIANLYFGTKANNNANNLFNFVNARIDVNGTVNAIKSNKIGGNLYFLSKEGLFVGAAGVINTGSLYVMTPAGQAANALEADFAYDRLKEQFTTSTPTESMDAYQRVVAANIPLNADATISVLGRINATDNIGLYAPRIAVGKNLLDDTAPVVSTASLKTGVTDFNLLVNTNGASGLTGDLTATHDPNTGDIILAARAEQANTTNADFNSRGAIFDVVNSDKKRTIAASVENHGNIDAARDAKLTATATNGNLDLALARAGEHPDYEPVAADDAEYFTQTTARVDVTGAVKSTRDTVLKAEANNTYIDKGSGINKITSLLEPLGIALDANVTLLDSQAAVSISSAGSVNTGGKADVTANSTLSNTVGLDIGGMALVNIGGLHSSVVPAVGVTYSKATNNAAVTVDGAVTAAQDLNIAAKAEETQHVTAAVSTSKALLNEADPSALVTAVNVSESDNHAKVTVNHTVQSTDGNIAITADAQTSLATTAAAAAADESMGSAAVNVTLHDSSATVDINQTVTAAGSLKVEAANILHENTVIASNVHGWGKFQADLMKAVNVQGIASAAESRLPRSITDKLDFLKGKDGDQPSPLANLFSAGAAIAVAEETNKARVTVAGTAGLQAGGDLSVNAKLLLEDTHMTADAKTSSFKEGAEKTVTIAAGFVYAGMDNSAEVDIKDRAAKADNVRLSGKNISITSSTVMEYNRINRMIRELERAIDKLEQAISDFDKYGDTASGNGKLVKDRLIAIKDSMIACKNSFISDQSPDAMTNGDTLDKIAKTAENAWHILTEAQALGMELGDLTKDLSEPFADLAGGAVSVVTGSLAFIEPSNYANFSAGAAAAGGKDTQLSVAGSVSITNIDHASRVRIGRNAELTAVNTLAVDSRNEIADVNTTGKMMFWTPSAAGGPGAAVGGSFNYQDFDTHSLVAVAEAASLKGGDVKLTSDSDIFHVGAMMSAGMTDGSALSGMASFTTGDSTNVVSVDDGAFIIAAKRDAADPATKDNTGLINLAAVNNTNVNNAIVSFVVGGGNAGVGVGVAINNLGVNNIAAIGDNSQKQAGGIDLTGLFGNDWQSTNSGTGKLAARDLTLTAATGGIINAAAIAGGATHSSDDPSPGILDKIAAPFKKLSDLTKGNMLKGITAVSGKLQDSLNAMGSASKAQGAADTPSVPAPPAEGGEGGGTPDPAPPEAPEANVPKISLAGAGSVAVNLVDNHTKAVIDNVSLELDDGKLSVGAKDSAFISAWSGSAAISWRGGQNSDTTSVAFAGAVGVNDVNGETAALVRNSRINKAKDIDIMAASGGTQAAAGLTATFTKGGSGSNTSNYSGAASVSVNLIDRSTNATLEAADVNQTTAPATFGNLDVNAYARDVQVTGGINAQWAASGGDVGGAAVTVADITNKLDAGIKGSRLDKLNNVQVQSLLATTQVTAAVSVGAATGGSGGSTNNAFSGAVIYNGFSNQANAVIDGTAINAAGSVSANAHDTGLNAADAKKYQDWLGSTTDRDTAQFNRSGLGKGGADGTDYYQDLDTGATRDDREDSNKALDLNNHGKTGSTIVTAALVGVGSNGNAAGVAVNVGNIDNNFAAGIKNSTITADRVSSAVNADTLLVGVAGGVAAGTKTFGGMGSVSWQTIDNRVAAAIDNADLTTNAAAVKAANSSLVVNAAGQVTVGKKAALGATLAYNAIDNKTGAAISGSVLTAKDAAKGIDIAVTAAGATDIYGIGASVAASSGNTAASGTVVINRGKSETEAAIDDQDAAGKRTKLTNVKHLDVTTTDAGRLTAAVANSNGASKVAVGAGVAVNDIGGTVSGRQNLTARLDKSDITTVADSTINVSAEDKARLITIAAGIGGSGKVAVQGAAATALVNKQLSASMTGTNIDKTTANAGNATVTVSADNQSDLYTVALVAAGSGTAAIGAGVSVNSIQQGTVAQLDGGTQNIRDLLLTTKASPSIYTAGIGGGAAGDAGIAGSVAVNMIDNNSSARISGDAQITAQNNIGLVAESDELITNYAGVLSVSGTAAIGASVSVNEINGNTVAAIDGSGTEKTKVTALGQGGAVTTHGTIDDSAIVDTVVTGTSFDPTDNLRNKRQAETKTGIVVDASGTRTIRSVLANVSGSGTAAVAGTVNVNKIDGSTAAGITDASLTGGNVSVRAGDYTNSAGFVGTGTGSGNAAVGLSSDTNLVNRATGARISGSQIKALDLAVNATGKQGISSFGAGIAVAGEGAGIAGTVGVARLTARTTAELIDTEADVGKLDIMANHLGRVSLGAGSGGVAGIGAGAGLAVGVTDDSSVTEALVTNSQVTSKDHTTIRAFNTTGLKTYITSLGVGAVGAGVSGSVSVNNINSQIRAKVTGSELTLASNSEKVIAVEGRNALNIDANTGGLAAGAAGVGASVSVNTVDSQVEAAVDNATLTNNSSGKILVNADETRDIRQFAVNAAAGVGALSANIMVTNIGKALSEAGGDNDGANAEKDAAGEVKRVNTVYGGDDLLSGDLGARETGNSHVTQTDLAVNAGQGRDNGSLIKAAVSGSELKTGGDIAIGATETDKIDINSGNIAIGIGGPSFNASVGILNVNRNTAVALNNATLRAAKDIQINALVQDKDFGVRLNMLQGTGSIYSAGLTAGYARLRTQGASNIDITDSVLNTGNNILITAQDQGSAAINALGLTVGTIAAGVLVADAANDSDVAVNIDYSGFYADTTSVTAAKLSTVTANTVGGAVGIGPLAAVGIAATATDNGQSLVTAQKGSLFQGGAVSLLAQNAPAVKANAGSLAAALSGAGGVSVAIAKATGTANLNVLNENTFDNDIVNFNAIITTQNDKATAQADAAGLAAAGIAGLGFNLSQAESATGVNVTIDRQYYKRSNTALTISGRNDTKQQAQTKSLTIGGLLAAGSNKAETSSTGLTIVNANGGTVGSLTVNAVGSADNTALADGGGGGLVAAGAAIAENTMNSDTVVNLGGNWIIGGSLTASASQNDTANLNADSVQGGAFAINGAKAANTIGNKDQGTAVNILDGAYLNAAAINLTARNNLAVNNRQTYMAEGAGYGVFAAQGAKAESTVVKNAAVNAGKNSHLTARTGDLTLAALTEGAVNSKASMKTGGLVATVKADNTNTVTVSNAVTLAEGAQAETLKYGGDVTLAASDTLVVSAAATADNQGGAAGGSEAVMTNTLQRSNIVRVDGAIRSLRDVNLYAGTGADGAKALLKLDTAAEAYNKSVLALARPALTSVNNQANQVTVSGTGAVDSVRHINLAANQGREYVEETTATYTWYEGENTNKSFTGTAAGTDSKGKHSNNSVQLDGQLTAGTQNKLNITINGSVAPPGGTIEGGSDLTVTVDTGNAAYDNELKNKITTGTINYGNELFARWLALSEVISEYSGKDKDNKDLTAYVGYLAEQERVFNQMKALGLVTTEEITYNGKTTTVYNVSDGFKVNCIELPDLAASGGNIVIDADNLAGSGRLTAKGAPEINVTNNSSYYLKINDAIIGDKGGEIKFNNTVLTGDSAAANAAIKAVNKDQTKAVNQAVIADGPDGAAKIVVTSNWNSPLNVTYTNPDNPSEKETISVKPLTSIEINGAIENRQGKIEITNKGGDILIQGKSDKDNASVQGKEIELNAANGSVTQGYIDGIVNIGGAPEDDWDPTYESIRALVEYGLDLTVPKHAEASVNTTLGKGGSWIAGDSIYINAADINVNGTIQSGYDDYRVTVSQAALDDAKNASLFGSRAVVINGETLIKINDGNTSVYDPAAGKYIYEVQAYYNPRTGKIAVDDIATKGGQVYLTGRIASTGKGNGETLGKIIALDGGANITIVNDANADLQLGSITNNNIAGLIKITDLNTNKVTEYTRTQTKVSDLLGSNSQTSGPATVYNPQSGLRYNWARGRTQETAETYQNDVTKGLWGEVTVGNSTLLTEYEKNNQPVVSIPGGSRDKKSGSAFIEAINVADNTYDYALIFDNIITSQTRSPVEHWRTSSGFLGWYKHDHYRWTVRTGSSQTYLNTVKADKPISIGFIGQENGNIDITGRQNVELLGNIRNNTSAATLQVAAGNSNSFGAISQLGGSIYGGDVKLTAVSGINDIHITSLSDTVRLYADNARSGNIDINVDGGWANNRQFAGNIALLRAVTSPGESYLTKGNISLTARGDITQADDQLRMLGNRIDLTSTHGAIGTASQALVLWGGQEARGGDSLSASVNATAKGDIHLAQSHDNMRVGIIDSAEGDVTLTARNGSFIDALPSGKATGQDTIDKKIQKWQDLGLIAGDGAFTEKRARQAADYKSAVEADYQTYQAQKTYYDSHPDQQTGPAYAAYQGLAVRFTDAMSAADYLANDTKYQELIKAPAYQWTQEQLLYALQDAMINKEGGSSQTEIKAANISGRNITLTANNGGIGIDTGAVTITDFSDVNNLKQLANAEALDVTWTKNAAGQFQSATINGKSPLGIHTRNDGVLNAVARDNIYIAGRTEGQDTPLYIDKVTTTGGNIRVLGKAGVFSVNPDLASPNFSGKDLLVEGGTQSIGTIDNAIRTALFGQLTARTDGSAYIRDISGNGFTISSIYAGDNLWLRSSGAINSFYNATDPDDPLNLGRITAQHIDIESTGANVGTYGQALRITNLAADKAAEATTRIVGQKLYLKGITAPGEEDGTLVLTEITATAANGMIAADSTGNIALTGDITAANTIDLNAQNGAVSQSGGKVAAGALAAAAKTGIDLNSAGNTMNQLIAANDTGDITVRNTGASGLAVTVSKANAGAITIENQTGSLTVNAPLAATGDNGSITLLNHNGSINAQAVTAGNNVILQTETGNIAFTDVTATRNADFKVTQQGDITGTNLQAKSGTATVDTTKGDIDITTAQTGTLLSMDSQAGNIKVGSASGTDVSLFAKTGDIEATTVTAGKDALLQTQAGNIELTGAVTAGQDAKLQTTAGNITFTDVTANRNADIKVTQQGNITGTNLQAKSGTVTVDTTKGAIDITAAQAKELLRFKSQAGNIKVGTANGTDVSLFAKTGDMQVGTVTTGNDALLQTETGNIAFTDITASRNADIKVAQQGDITGGNAEATTGTLTVETAKGTINLGKTAAGTDISLANQNGDIELSGDAKAGQDAKLLTTTGNITFTNLTASQNADIKVTQQGNITGTNLQAKSGAATVDTTKGAIDITAAQANELLSLKSQAGNIKVDAANGSDVSLFAKAGDMQVGTTTASNNALLQTETGNIKLIVGMTAGNDLLLQTQAGNIAFTDITANRNAAIKVAQQGDITGGNAKATTGTLTVETAKGKILLGKTTAGTDISLTNHNGDIELIGDAKAGQDAKLQTATGDITFRDILANQNVDIQVTTAGDITGTNLQAKSGGATVDTTKGAIDITAAQAKELLSLKSQAGNIKVNAANGSDVSLFAKAGDMQVGAVTAGNDALLQTETGNIAFADITASRNTDIKVAQQGGITGGNAKATTGTLTVETANGKILLGKTTAGTDISLANQNGDIELAGDAKAGQDAKLLTTTGNITFTNVTASQNADIKVTQQGNITGTNLQAKSGAATVDTTKGAIDITAGQAKELLRLKSQAGNIKVGTANGTDVSLFGKTGDMQVGTVTAGNNALLQTETGNIAFADITANRNADIKVAQQGDITGGNAKATTGTLTVETAKGKILLGKTTAGTDISLTNHNGDIELIGDAKAGQDAKLQTATGDITFRDVLANQNVDIQVTTAGDITGTNLQAKSGGATVDTTKGAIDITAAQAKELLSLKSQAGNIKVDAANGSDVSLFAKAGDMQVGAVTAGNDALLQTATGNIELTGAVTAGQDAKLQTAAGNITFTDVTTNRNADIKVIQQGNIIGTNLQAKSGTATVDTAKGAIDITAAQAKELLSLKSQSGHIKVGAASGTDVSLFAKAGDMQATTVTADNDALLQTETGNIAFADITASRNADIKVAQQGDITGGNAEATTGTLTVETAKGKILLGKTTAGTDISLTNQNGDIELSGDAKAGQDAKLQTATGDITFTDVTANRNAAIKVTQQGDITGDNAEVTTGTLIVEAAKGTIRLGKTTAGTDISLTNRNGDIELTGVANAGQDAKLQTATGNITFADVAANRNVAIKITQDGDISGASLQTKSGAATVDTTTGDIDITTTQAGTMLSMDSQAGNIKVGTAAGGTDVSLFAKAGDIQATTVTAGNDALLQTETGNINLTSGMTAGNDAIVQMQAGNIELTGAVVAGQDAQLQTAAGNITFTGITANRHSTIKITQQGDITGDNAEATIGTLTVETAKGKILLGKTTAGTDISLTNRNGGITLTGTVAAGNDTKLQTANGDIAFTDITANRQVSIEALQSGSVTGGNIQATNDTLTVRTAKGAISLTGDVAAGVNASLTATSGNIAFRDVLANQNVDIQVTTAGDISGRDVKAVNDSLNIQTVKGDINLRNVYAGKRAAVGADDGKITMFSIDGETVIIRVKNKDTDLHVPTITAGKNIIITSSGIDIDQISQRPGYDGMLLFTPKPADPNTPMEYFTIGDIKTQNGLKIEELWAKQANVHVDTKRFYLDRLSITDTGHFSNDNASVTVYGNSSPALSSADIHFWYNPELRNPWMYLHFLRDDHTVESNGILLSNKDHFDVYRQHFSGVAEMNDQIQQQMSRDNWLLWQYLRDPATAYGNYERFNLLDASQAGLSQIQPLILQPTDGNGENQLTEM